ncbi:uncharacterized protein LOC119711128 isoform X2 [Motacilla alba alba]|uniref:uncharacterized protein LOC119711128 isoform X2 n=1 Tax=Motacilla alba alba TaxID=1094192 RepID=UPI0018D53EB0|nr:uncharacterized protein LOC119711128 isoform X2 [Motacilla alba alba]
MGRQRSPPGRCWARLLRAGGRRLLRLCGTALRALRRLWSLAWVGTAQPEPREPPKPLPAPNGARGRGAAGVQSLHRCCCGLEGVALGAKGGMQSLHCCCGMVGVALGAAGRVQSLHCCCGGLAGVAAGGGERLTAAPGAGAAPSSRGVLGSGRWAGGVVPTESPGDAGTPLQALHTAQVLLMCYKSCWDGAFQVTEEVTPRWESPSPGQAPGPLSPVAAPAGWHQGGPDRAGARGHGLGCPWTCEPPLSVLASSSAQPCSLDWRGARRRRMWTRILYGSLDRQWQRRSEAMLGRLEALEADVRFLCTELGAEKLLWSSRFLELLREQQSLRQRLQELPWRWDSGDSPELLGEAEDQSASGSEGESPEGQWMEAPQQPRGSIQRDRQKM